MRTKEDYRVVSLDGKFYVQVYHEYFTRYTGAGWTCVEHKTGTEIRTVKKWFKSVDVIADVFEPIEFDSVDDACAYIDKNTMKIYDCNTGLEEADCKCEDIKE